MEASRGMRKPILASWMGEEDVREARELLRRNRVPTYPTPEQAISAFMHMYHYARNLQLLYETPEEIPLTLSADRTRLKALLKDIAQEGRSQLSKGEVKGFLEAYGIPVAEPFGEEGAQPQPVGRKVCDLMVGSKRDPLFGSVIIFGMGGAGSEVIKDLSFELPPLNQALARRLMERTRIYRLLTGYGKTHPPLDLRVLEGLLVRFSQMVVDFPEVLEVEVNPLTVGEGGVLALDGRIGIDVEAALSEVKPYEHLVIRPYPKKYMVRTTLRDGRGVLLRPVRPEDEPLMVGLFETFSKETMRFGFFHIVKEFPHETVARYCNIDYEREMTVVAEMAEEGGRRLIGMARLIVQPDGESGEIAIIIGDPWQGLGLGTRMLDHIIEVARDMGLKMVFGEILSENTRMIHLCYKRGFDLRLQDEESYIATLNLY